MNVSRRHFVAGLAAAAIPNPAKAAPDSTVAIARCRSFSEDLYAKLGVMFDQIGGIGPLVRNKTVALKLNLTGNPRRFPVDPAMPYRTDPDTALAAVTHLARAGAKRIRILETFFPARQEMELWARYGLDLKAIENCGAKVEWENAQNMGRATKYVRVKVPWGGYVFPAYDVNHSWVDCDTFVSMSKLKNHWIAGVTMTLKNNFGVTPCALYGGDCGDSGNEDPQKERGQVCHNGEFGPPKGVPQEIDPASPRDSGYRVPRITADLVGVRPVDLSIVDGIETIRGGEGSWNKGVQIIKPGLLLAGKNSVCVDTVCTAVMGYDPRATRGEKPFIRGDNTLLLCEQQGIGTTDMKRIEVAGLSIKEALHDFGPGPIGTTV